jgi:hypothetical protein
MGFEPTIPAFERSKTLHALDRAATDWQTVHITLIKFNIVNSRYLITTVSTYILVKVKFSPLQALEALRVVRG